MVKSKPVDIKSKSVESTTSVRTYILKEVVISNLHIDKNTIDDEDAAVSNIESDTKVDTSSKHLEEHDYDRLHLTIQRKKRLELGQLFFNSINTNSTVHIIV